MRYALAFSLLLQTVPAMAVEVGDVIMLSTNGVGSTITEHRQQSRSVHFLQAETFSTNVAEYCQRYEQIQRGDNGWDRCMSDNKSSEKIKLVVDCSRPTVVIEGNGAYRPQRSGGPWVSVADANSIIQADHLYTQVCGRRR